MNNKLTIKVFSQGSFICDATFEITDQALITWIYSNVDMYPHPMNLNITYSSSLAFNVTGGKYVCRPPKGNPLWEGILTYLCTSYNVGLRPIVHFERQPTDDSLPKVVSPPKLDRMAPTPIPVENLYVEAIATEGQLCQLVSDKLGFLPTRVSVMRSLSAALLLRFTANQNDEWGGRS